MGAARIIGWEVFLGSINVVSLHVPATPDTQNLIDAVAIQQMRPGTCLVNTARGDLIDDDAVLAALTSGHLGGVGLDVLRGEPHFDPRWFDAPNAILLPHIGSATHQTRIAMGQSVLAALSAQFGIESAAA
jgi:glyoxylate reductase